MNSFVHVALASDSATSAGLAVAGYSAIKHTSRPVVLWVIQEGLDSETISALRAFWSGAAEVHFLSMKTLPWWWTTESIPLLSWARIQLAELLPHDIMRCIYLDTDTLVGRDLVELSDLALDGDLIGMVITDRMPPNDIEYVRSLGVDPNRWYNAGVALVDLEAWRLGGVTDGLLRCKKSMPPNLWFKDQDLLNKFFAGRVRTLDPSWNRRDSAYCAEGQILHLAGIPKPWEISGDTGLAGLKAWHEVYRLWGRAPHPKRQSRIKLRAAVAVRHFLELMR